MASNYELHSGDDLSFADYMEGIVLDKEKVQFDHLTYKSPNGHTRFKRIRKSEVELDFTCEDEEFCKELAELDQSIHEDQEDDEDNTQWSYTGKARRWCFTVPVKYVTPLQFFEKHKDVSAVKYIFVSDVHDMCDKNKFMTDTHFHAYICLDNPFRVTKFDRVITDNWTHNKSEKDTIWICKLEKRDSDIIGQASAKYFTYCFNKGPNYYEYPEEKFPDVNYLLPMVKSRYLKCEGEPSKKMKKDDKGKEIISRIKEGEDLDSIIQDFPSEVDWCVKLYQRYRPAPKGLPSICIFIHGPSGSGKSTVVADIGRALRFANVSTYHQPELGKFVYSYNQQLVWIVDDFEVSENVENNKFMSTKLKNLISADNPVVNSKYCDKTIESQVFILLHNYSPEQIAQRLCNVDKEPILRRLKEYEFKYVFHPYDSTEWHQQRQKTLKKMLLLITKTLTQNNPELKFDVKDMYQYILPIKEKITIESLDLSVFD